MHLPGVRGWDRMRASIRTMRAWRWGGGGVACMCHVGRVAGELGLARGGGVRVGCGPSTGSGRTASLAPPLWIPAFAGMTSGGVRERRETERPPRPCPGFPLSRERRWGSAGRQALLVAKGWGVPLGRDGRFAKRPYEGVWGVSGMLRGLGVRVPRPVPGSVHSYDPSVCKVAAVLRWRALAAVAVAPFVSAGAIRLMAWDPVLGSW